MLSQFAWFLLLASAQLSLPLFFLVRGKFEDWRSLAEYSVAYAAKAAREPSGNRERFAYYAKKSEDCSKAIPRLLRARYISLALSAAEVSEWRR